MGQVLFLDIFFEKDTHLNAVEEVTPLSLQYRLPQ